MLFVQREHIEVTSVGHVTFNSNAVLPVSESGVKYVIVQQEHIEVTSVDLLKVT